MTEKRSAIGPHDSESGQIGFDPMAERGKTTIRLDDALRADAQRCADERSIKLAEFVRQAIVHYVAWCASQRDTRNDLEAPADQREPPKS